MLSRREWIEQAKGRWIQYTFVLGPLSTNAYLLINPQTRGALLIDAPDGAKAAIEEPLSEHQAQLNAILLTHGHFDHIGGLADLAPLKVPVYGHLADLPLIENPYSPYYPQVHTQPGHLDHSVTHGQVLDLLGTSIRVSHTPGHSPGSVCYHFDGQGRHFVGDVIFYKSVGRTDFPGCSFRELEQSIQQHVYSLPESDLLFPGHGKRTQVATERQENPYVRPVLFES